ncbi:CoA-binding protein [Inediibacterium massiliense]|uniref:CoA-binding protein n=1 Tax=Inediibacterium massiliense TaxID=1658111 RepID=UPI002E8DFF16|nr:CoA-binding protein [Inediibacterium massiliense]
MLKYKNWAVVGDVLNQRKFAYKIKNRLIDAGYIVSLVNPRESEHKVFHSLQEIKEKVDVIDLCINPKLGIDIVKKAHNLGIDHIFIQPGAESEEILLFCKEHDMKVIQSCVLVELSKRGI